MMMIKSLTEDFPELKFAKKYEDKGKESIVFGLVYDTQMRTILSSSWSGMGFRAGQQLERSSGVRLAFPYLIFLVRFDIKDGKHRYAQTGMACSGTAIESVNDEVYRLPLSNIYKVPFQMGLCMYPDNPTHESWKDNLRQIITDFWSTEFTGKVPHCQYDIEDERIKNTDKWAEATKEDPDVASKIVWPKPFKDGLKFRTFCDYVASEDTYGNGATRTNWSGSSALSHSTIKPRKFKCSCGITLETSRVGKIDCPKCQKPLYTPDNLGSVKQLGPPSHGKGSHGPSRNLLLPPFDDGDFRPEMEA